MKSHVSITSEKRSFVTGEPCTFFFELSKQKNLRFSAFLANLFHSSRLLKANYISNFSKLVKFALKHAAHYHKHDNENIFDEDFHDIFVIRQERIVQQMTF